MISLKLFGTAAEATAATGPPLPPGKPLALLAYLACAPNSSATRTRLVDLLWSDVDLDAGKHALRQTLWYIKRRLGEGIVLAENDHLRLAPGYECDRTDFLAAIDRGDLEQAVNLYTGPFFPDFAAPGGAEFERWADVERAHLCGKFVRAAEEVCRQWMHNGNMRPAVALARRARDADPENESVWRLMLECLLAASDRIGAASEADALLRALAEDEREPEIATSAIVRAVRNVERASAEPADARTKLFAELVGREQEFSAIISAWERTGKGHSAHIHLTAPAGLGKTRLIAAVEARLRASRARVVRIRAASGERQMAYALAAELAVSLAKLRGAAGVSSGAAAALVALNPVVSTWLSAAPDVAGGDDVLRRRSLAMHELLAAVSTETPVALLIDDLHWADSESLQLLNSVSARLHNMSTLLVTASRPPSPIHVDSVTQHMIPLLPLDAAHVGALVASIAALPDETWADALPAELHSATGGSPLLVLEMLQFALDQERLAIELGAWRCDNNDALFTVMRPGRAVERRVAELDSAARMVLLHLAVAGVPTSTRMLSISVQRSEHDIEATVARLEQSGLVIRDGTNWLPQHDEIAAAAVLAADESQRRAVQRGIALAYSQTSPSDLAVLRRALAHAVESADDALLSRLSSDYVREARAQGDRRSAVGILSGTLGQSAAPAIVRGIVATLPLRERVSWKAVQRYAATAAGLAVVSAATLFAFFNLQPKPDNELIVQVLTDGDTSFHSVGRVYSPNESDGPIDIAKSRRIARKYSRVFSLAAATESADRKRWVGWRNAGTPLNPEIFVWDGGDSEEPAASNREDDVAPSWSPDGKWMLFLSRRWSDRNSADKNFATDIALRNIETGDIRRVLATADNENAPWFSPDGSRIAFTVTRNDSLMRDVCWVSFDGLSQSCHHLPELAPLGASRWFGGNTIIFDARIRANESLGLFKWLIDSDSIALIDSGATQYQLSPDGREVFFQRLDQLSATTRAYLAQINDMSRPRMLSGKGSLVMNAVWRAPRRPAPHLASVKMENATTPVPIDVEVALTARTYDNQGNELMGLPLRFFALGSHETQVTRGGVLVSPVAGSIRVVVSAGGYISDTALIRAIAMPPVSAMEERWNSVTFARWRRFGIPEPRLISDIDTPDGETSAVLMDGDGDYISGLFNPTGFPATDALGVRLNVSVPLNAERGQQFALSLQGLPDSATLVNTELGGIGLPDTWTDPTTRPSCAMSAPARGGRGNQNTLALTIGREGAVKRVAPSIVDGSWHRWSIQIMPNGTCRFAIDEEVIWTSTKRIPTGKNMNVVLSGNSLNTRILAGAVQAWTGVDPLNIRRNPSPTPTGAR